MLPWDRVTWIEHESEVLKGNPLGDPHVRTFPVYLPPDYDASPDRRYPVVYWLTGFTGVGYMYLYKRFLQPSRPEAIDDLILNEGMPGVICVFVDCLTSLGGSQYVNSSATGDYDDYLVREIVPFIDERFRSNGRRGCIGGSSGGIGSFIMGARHPDVFQGVADHSGDSAFEYCYLADVPRVVSALKKYDYDIGKFVEQIADIEPRDNDFQVLLNMAAMSACYAPNPESPHGFDLPFDPYDGALRAEVWEKFRAHDPVNMVAPLADNLRKLRFIWIDCGTRDQFHLWLGSRQLHRQLEAHDIAHTYEEYDSDHFLLRYAQKKKSLPALVAAINEGV